MREAERLRGGPKGEAWSTCGHLHSLLARRAAPARALEHTRCRCRWCARAAACARRCATLATNVRRGSDDPDRDPQRVRTLQAQGTSLREISRLLRLSRNTVRRILREPRWPPRGRPAVRRGDAGPAGGGLRAGGGNVVRVQEMLAAETVSEVAYSTLTRWVRQAGLRSRRGGPANTTSRRARRCSTTPRRTALDVDRQARHAQCAGLVLAYSRRLFIQYYPRFTRFEAKHFLLEAARFMDGVCPRCIIDNTSVLLAAGAGADAVIAPEMAAFARCPGLRLPRPSGRRPGSQGPDRAALRLCRRQLPGRPGLRRLR